MPTRVLMADLAHPRRTCEACGAAHSGVYGSGRYCGPPCAKTIGARKKWAAARAARATPQTDTHTQNNSSDNALHPGAVPTAQNVSNIRPRSTCLRSVSPSSNAAKASQAQAVDPANLGTNVDVMLSSVQAHAQDQSATHNPPLSSHLSPPCVQPQCLPQHQQQPCEQEPQLSSQKQPYHPQHEQLHTQQQQQQQPQQSSDSSIPSSPLANCESCGAPHDESYGSGRFCSVHCARRVAAARKWAKQRGEKARRLEAIKPAMLPVQLVPIAAAAAATSPSPASASPVSAAGKRRRTSSPRIALPLAPSPQIQPRIIAATPVPHFPPPPYVDFIHPAASPVVPIPQHQPATSQVPLYAAHSHAAIPFHVHLSHHPSQSHMYFYTPSATGMTGAQHPSPCLSAPSPIFFPHHHSLQQQHPHLFLLPNLPAQAAPPGHRLLHTLPHHVQSENREILQMQHLQQQQEQHQQEQHQQDQQKHVDQEQQQKQHERHQAGSLPFVVPYTSASNVPTSMSAYSQIALTHDSATSSPIVDARRAKDLNLIASTKSTHKSRSPPGHTNQKASSAPSPATAISRPRQKSKNSKSSNLPSMVLATSSAVPSRSLSVKGSTTVVAKSCSQGKATFSPVSPESVEVSSSKSSLSDSKLIPNRTTDASSCGHASQEPNAGTHESSKNPNSVLSCKPQDCSTVAEALLNLRQN